MSSGGNNTSTQTSSAPPWVQDASKGYLDRATQISDNPYTPSPNQAIGPNATQSTAWDAIKNRAIGGSPVQSAGNQTLTDTLQGKYLDSNPYLDGIVNKAQGDVVRNYNNVVRPGQDAAMIRSGSFGNSGLQQQTMDQDQQLEDSLGNISTQIRGGAYANERQNQQGALGYVPQAANQDYTDAQHLLDAGNQQGQFSQNQAGQNLNWWNEAQQYPTAQLNTLGNAIGTVNGTARTQTSTTPGTSTAAGIAGGALTAAQIGSLLGLFGKGGG